MRSRPDWRERVREALVLGNHRECLDRVIDCFHDAWLGTAAWVWMHPRFPKTICKPEDLHQEFVTKLLAAQDLSFLNSLTSPEHVRNFLRRCLINHCWTIARGTKKQLLPPKGGDPAPDRPAPSEVLVEEAEEITVSETQRRVESIRQEFPESDQSVPPTRHLLLLLERRWLLEFVGKSFLGENDGLPEDVVPFAKVEGELSVWSADEARQSMTAQAKTLQEVWDEVKRLACLPAFEILDYDIAVKLEMRPNTLTTRKLRAWRILGEKYGVAYPKYPTAQRSRKKHER